MEPPAHARFRRLRNRHATMPLASDHASQEDGSGMFCAASSGVIVQARFVSPTYLSSDEPANASIQKPLEGSMSWLKFLIVNSNWGWASVGSNARFPWFWGRFGPNM